MSNVEFLVAFSLMPIGALLAAAIVLYFTRNDRHRPHAPAE
jgi:hypothetical protein